jgi:flagellar protein FlbT
MYLSADPKAQHAAYFELVKDVVRAAPSALPYIEAVNNEILTGSLYKALKKTQALIAYERELLDHAKCGTGVR